MISTIRTAAWGSGTVTTASKAGASFGSSLLWALLFSVFATIVLQEMAATGRSLAELVGASARDSLPDYQLVEEPGDMIAVSRRDVLVEEGGRLLLAHETLDEARRRLGPIEG